MKAIINARIYDYENYIENGYIIYNDKIVDVGDMADFDGHYELYDAKGMLILPGLINSHTHIYSALFRGSPLNASPNDFIQVLEQIWWKFDKALTLDAIKESAKAYCNESLLSGVTSLIDHHASGEIENSLLTLHHQLDHAGIKHLLCFESSDRYDIDACIDENTKYSSIKGHFGLHAGLSLSDASLEKIAARREKPIHVHVAESDIDEQISMASHGMRVVKRLEKYNLLSEDSILAHCLYINDEEAALIKKYKCSVAINPTSNLNNAVGLYNQSLLHEYDIPILVGTDGLGPNVAKEYQNLYYVGNQSNVHPSQIDLDWIKKQLKHSYAYFNKMNSTKIGLIEKDYISDFIMIDYQDITPINKDNIFGHVLFGVFEALKPHTVIIDGVKRVDQYALVNKQSIDHDIVEKLWRKL